MATLLPNGVQQFFSANGTPLNAGSVTFYVPGTTTPKDTWQDAAQTILNTNPVILDTAGEAIIYGTGSYRQIVQDSAGNTIWDELTSDTAVGGVAAGGTSTGTPNAQVIAASSFTQQNEQQIVFIVGDGLTNTGDTTIAPGGGAGIPVLKDTAAGPTPLTGGELVAANAYTLTYDQARGAFHVTATPQSVPTTFADNTFNIYDSGDSTKKLAFDASGISTGTTRTVTAADASGVMMLTGAGITDVASASVMNLGASPTIDIRITGSSSITDFGSAPAGTRRKGYCAGSPVFVYNSSKLVLPGGANISASPSDRFEALCLAPNDWIILWYQKVSGTSIYGLAVNQTWQNVIGSRAVNTTYQNTTSSPIMVSWSGQSASGSVVLAVSTDASAWVTMGSVSASSNVGTITAVVPPSHYYRVTLTGGATSYWAELR